MDKRAIVKKVIEECIDEASAQSDEDVMSGWSDVGKRLQAADAEEFVKRYRAHLRRFDDRPDLEPTPANWTRLGVKLIAQDRRGTVREILVVNWELDRRDEDSAVTS